MSPPPLPTRVVCGLGLSSAQIEVLSRLAFRLSEIPGVAAVVLGGSYARGIARPDSDLDIGVYYSEQALPDIDAVRHCAELVSTPDQPPTVTRFYAWGPWVNGGAWIRTPAGKVDLLYRNANQVRRVLDEGHQGLHHHDFYQQPTFGFTSLIYFAETRCCLPLFDRQELISELKSRVAIYPAPLQDKVISDSLWNAEFTFVHAQGFAGRGDVFNTAGCLAKIAFMLAQALFALNAEYYFGDKGALETIDRFPRQPKQFSARLQRVLATPGTTPSQLEGAVCEIHKLWQETVNLTEGKYAPRFTT
jgi:hypothetical protein